MVPIAASLGARSQITRRTSGIVRNSAATTKLSTIPSAATQMNFVVAGHSNKEVARKLAVSPRTVEVHRLHMMEKMGAGSLAELVRMALAVDGA